MIEVMPNLLHQSNCPYCKVSLNNLRILWLGMRVCIESECSSCNTKITEDLRIAHALTFPCQVDLAQQVAFCSEESKIWFGQPLLQSLKNLQNIEVEILKETFVHHQKVIVLNCIDLIYGHSASSNLKCITLAQNCFRHLRRSLGHLILYVLVAAGLVGSSSIIIEPMTEAVLSG